MPCLFPALLEGKKVRMLGTHCLGCGMDFLPSGGTTGYSISFIISSGLVDLVVCYLLKKQVDVDTGMENT